MVTSSPSYLKVTKYAPVIDAFINKISRSLSFLKKNSATDPPSAIDASGNDLCRKSTTV